MLFSRLERNFIPDDRAVARASGHPCLLRSNGVCRPVFDPEAEHVGCADLRTPLRAP